MLPFVSIRFCLFTCSRGNVSLVNKLGVENFPSPHVVSGITGGVVVTKTPLTVASVWPLSNSFEYLNSLTALRVKRNADCACNREDERNTQPEHFIWRGKYFSFAKSFTPHCEEEFGLHVLPKRADPLNLDDHSTSWTTARQSWPSWRTATFICLFSSYSSP